MPTWAYAAIAAAVVILAILLAVNASRRRSRRERLAAEFGPEYHRTVESAGSRRAAENDLVRREELRSQLDVHPLTPAARERFQESWQGLQSDFIDRPVEAVMRADGLIVDVLRERGYATNDIDEAQAAVSVDHPEIMDRYRQARRTADAREDVDTDTEDLRRAMLGFRAMLDELLVVRGGSDGASPATASDGAASSDSTAASPPSARTERIRAVEPAPRSEGSTRSESSPPSGSSTPG